MRRPWKIAAVALFTVSLLFGGFMGDRVLAVTDEARDWLRLYTELVDVVHDRYGGEVSYADLVQSSIGGMLRTLDPHTNFLPPRAYDTMRERQQSSFYGLGILVGMRHGQLTVINPLEGTPASRLGIRAGDVIAAIEGESTETMSLDDAVSRLKGPKGTQVAITIARRGLDIPLELTITRDEIPQNTVRYASMVTPETGYMTISDFNRATGKEVRETLSDLKEQGMTSLIVDLRGNGGGLLDQAIEVAEQFLPSEAKIVETRGRTRDSFQEFSANGEDSEMELPVVVLVGEGTASAAEILAGAIQDHDIGLIVGTPTWGKGLVQTVYSLSYGAGVALTTAKYYTPSGRLIQRDYTSWFDYTTNSNGEPEVVGLDPSFEEVFRTDLGREVYGGGGITPDIHVERPRLNTVLQYLVSRSAFFDFAVDYTRENAIESPDWTPGPELVDRFKDWLLENELLTGEEIERDLADPETRTIAERYAHAEIFASAFGMDARHRVLSAGDVQLKRALEVLEEASELLARRKRLDADEPDVTAAAAIEVVG